MPVHDSVYVALIFEKYDSYNADRLLTVLLLI